MIFSHGFYVPVHPNIDVLFVARIKCTLLATRDAGKISYIESEREK